MRVELFELWMRSDPKPRGGCINGMNVDDEFPVLHWLLREHVAEVFAALMDQRREELQEFVIWLLKKARHYAECFTSSYQGWSYVTYTYGRPRFRFCARLALEVEKSAIDLGINVPDDARLPEMPDLDRGGFSALFTSKRQALRFVRAMKEQQD